MDAAALKSLQDPLKARYREAPEAALVTLRAEGTLGELVDASFGSARELSLHLASAPDESALRLLRAE